MARRKVIVVGGGLAGLSAALKLAEKECLVHLVSVTPVKRSHSVCAQGGINAAFDSVGEGDSPLIHAYDTIKGGDFLANQPPIVEMCLAAPKIIHMLDRFGCPFNRTAEGFYDVRRFGGTLYNRTVFCGASTGQQLLYALDEQVRRHEVLGNVEKHENWEFMRLIRDQEGRARGIVMQSLFNLKLEVLRGDAVVFATGGPGMIFKYSTNSTFCTGAANGRLFLQGMAYANGEFIQIHPTAIPGPDKFRLMSESLRGEGARVWVYGDSSKSIRAPDGKELPCGVTGEPWYFLEELYPAFGNLVPRDVGAREILRICQMGLGVDGKSQVYLDASHLPEATLHKLESVLEIYQKFTGQDPRKVPMKIFPGVHYSMGGAWVDWPAHGDPDRESRYRQMTNIPGCFHAGESEYQYHGANRLGANALLSCIFSGLTAGCEVPRYLEAEELQEAGERIFQQELQKEEQFRRELMGREGKENVHKLHDELAEIMVGKVTVERSEKGLEKALEGIEEIKERFRRIQLDDHSRFGNQTYIFANQFLYMLELASVVTEGALLRKESRGSHALIEHPERNDEEWLKTTVCTYDSKEKSRRFTYEEVDLRHAEPVARSYVTKAKKKPTLQNVPDGIKPPF